MSRRLVTSRRRRRTPRRRSCSCPRSRRSRTQKSRRRAAAAAAATAIRGGMNKSQKALAAAALTATAAMGLYHYGTKGGTQPEPGGGGGGGLKKKEKEEEEEEETLPEGLPHLETYSGTKSKTLKWKRLTVGLENMFTAELLNPNTVNKQIFGSVVYTHNPVLDLTNPSYQSYKPQITIYGKDEVLVYQKLKTASTQTSSENGKMFSVLAMETTTLWIPALNNLFIEVWSEQNSDNIKVNFKSGGAGEPITVSPRNETEYKVNLKDSTVTIIIRNVARGGINYGPKYVTINIIGGEGGYNIYKNNGNDDVDFGSTTTNIEDLNDDGVLFSNNVGLRVVQ